MLYCFRDLNKVCPKDEFLLPNINMLVDATTGSLDVSIHIGGGFSGYN